MNKQLILSLTIISILVLFPITQSYAALLPFLGSSMISNSITRVVTSNGTVYSYNYSYPLNLVGKAGLTVTGSNKSGTIYLTAPMGVLPPTTTCANGYGFYKYNQTTNTYSCAEFNGVNSTNAVTSVNALSGAITIAGVAGNTTATTVGQTITINTAYNIVTTGLVAQTITKQLTLNNLVLGGNANGNSNSFTSLNEVNATKFFQNGNQVVDTLQATSPITVSPSHGNSITVACGTCLTSAPASTTVNTFSPTVNIVRQFGNTTVSNSSGTITIGLGVNPVITGGATQTVTKGLTINALTLGGAENANSQQINSLATPTHSTDAQVSNHLGLLGSLVVGACSNGNHISYQSSNSTWICDIATYLTSAITSINGNGAASQTIAATAPITESDAGATHTIACATCQTTTNANVTGSSLSSTDIPYASSSTQLKNTKTQWDSGNNAIDPTSDKAANLGANSTRFDHVTSNYQNATEDITNQVLFNIIGDPSATKGLCWYSSTTNDTIKCSDAHSIFTVVTTKSVINATTGQLSGNGTGSSSTTLKMDGVYATLIPANTGRIIVHVTGAQTSSISGDGCSIGVYENTVPTSNAGALSGTLLGTRLHLKSSAVSDPSGFSRIYDFSGSIGTKYYFDLAFAATTGGTCTISDVNWDLVEH